MINKDTEWSRSRPYAVCHDITLLVCGRIAAAAAAGRHVIMDVQRARVVITDVRPCHGVNLHNVIADLCNIGFATDIQHRHAIGRVTCPPRKFASSTSL